MCNPHEISLFSNYLSRNFALKQMLPPEKIRRKREKGKFQSRVGFAGLAIEKGIFSFVNKERIVWKGLDTQ